MKMTIRQDLRLELKYRCVVCYGTGKVSGHFHDGEPWEETCPVCNGTGKIPDHIYKEYTHGTADDRETDVYPDLP